MENKKSKAQLQASCALLAHTKENIFFLFSCLCWASLLAWFPIMPQHKC